jgi:Protein of unknown function (DUF2905)
MPVMDVVVTSAIIVLVLALIGVVADRRAKSGDSSVTPGLSLLPGDITYESPGGGFRVYFPIATSIVLSIILTLLLRWLQ